MFNHRNRSVYREKRKLVKGEPNFQNENSSSLNLSFLDYMSVEDFINAIRTSTDCSSQNLLRLIFSVSSQLKGLRALLSLHSFLTSNETTSNVLDRVMETAYFILDAENLFLLRENEQETDFEITHSNVNCLVGLKIPSHPPRFDNMKMKQADSSDSFRSRVLLALESVLPGNTRSLILSPVLLHGSVVGYVAARNKLSSSSSSLLGSGSHFVVDDTVFQEGDETLLGFISVTVAIAVKHLSFLLPSSSSSVTNSVVSPEIGQIGGSGSGGSDTTRSQAHSTGRRDSARALSGKIIDPLFLANVNGSDLEGYLQRIIEYAYKKTGADRISVFLHNPATSMLECIISQDILGYKLSSSVGIAGSAFQSAQVINVTETARDSRHYNDVDAEMGYQTHSLLCAPVVNEEGKSVGVVQAINKKTGNQFTSQDEEIIVDIGKKLIKLLQKKDEGGGGQGGNDQSATDFHHLYSIVKAASRFNNCQGLHELRDELVAVVSSVVQCDFVGLFEVQANADGKICLLAVSREGKAAEGRMSRPLSSHGSTAPTGMGQGEEGGGGGGEGPLPSGRIDSDPVFFGSRDSYEDMSLGGGGPGSCTSSTSSPTLRGPFLSSSLHRGGAGAGTGTGSSHSLPSHDSTPSSSAKLPSTSSLPRSHPSVTTSSSSSSHHTQVPPLRTKDLATAAGRVSSGGGSGGAFFVAGSVSDSNGELKPNPSLQPSNIFAPAVIMDVIRSGAITELSVGEGTGGDCASARDDFCFLPLTAAQHLIISPVSVRVPVYTDRAMSAEGGDGVTHKSFVLLATRNSTSSLPFGSRGKRLVELISSHLAFALHTQAQKSQQESFLVSLEQQFHIVNSTLFALPDHVMILDAEGHLIAANKGLQEFLSDHASPTNRATNTNTSTTSVPTSPSLSITPGHHYSSWLHHTHCPLLVDDIEAVIRRPQLRRAESVLFTSPCRIDPVVIDYDVFVVDSDGLSSSRSRAGSPPPPLSLPSRETGVSGRGSGEFGSSGAAAVGDEAVTVVAVVVVIKPVERLSNPFVTITHKHTQGRIMDPSLLHTPAGLLAVADSLLDSCTHSFDLTPSVQTDLEAASLLLCRASRGTRSEQTAVSRREVTAITTTTTTTDSPSSYDVTTTSSSSSSSSSTSLSSLRSVFEPPATLFGWDFNCLEITDRSVLCQCVGLLFERVSAFTGLDIDTHMLAAYINAASKNYHNNPFHNFQHASTVTHFTFKLIECTGACTYLPPLKIFSMMLAAVVHDLDHPGNTNAFEINCCSELALRYNDQSVLENHHCSTAFRLMRRPGLDLLGTFKAGSLDVRKTTIACIISTDMALHFPLIEEIKRFSQQSAAVTDRKKLFAEAADQLFFCKTIVHAADLSNPVRPFSMTRRWAELISEEFNKQVKLEESLGLPVLAFMVTRDEKTLCKNEMGFASFVVAPMWRALAVVLQELQPLVSQLDSNCAEWKGLLDQCVAEEEAAEEAAAAAAATSTNTTSSSTSTQATTSTASSSGVNSSGK